MTQDLDIELEDEGLFEHHRIMVDAGQLPERLDKFLLDKLPNTTRNRIQNSIKNGFVKIDNQEITKSNTKIKPKQEITIFLPHPPRNEELKPEKLNLDIVFEDSEILIINKKPGMVVHPGYNNWSGTLINGLLHHLQSIDLPVMEEDRPRPGLVHRIDKDTSGLLVIAKTENAMNKLAKQFYDHSIDRTYNALVWGNVKQDSGTITGHIGRSLKDRRVMTVFEDGSFGKHAVTHYKVLERFHYVTLIECKLETGRTHQIRAHMKFIGHPLFNDEMYGGDRILVGETFSKYKQFVENTFETLPRQALHAKTLGFIHPADNKVVRFDSEIPDDFSKAIERWRNYSKHLNEEA
jgi:23S rRNA pseudouridine1911/1915/1917 synthase